MELVRLTYVGVAILVSRVNCIAVAPFLFLFIDISNHYGVTVAGVVQ